MHEIQYPLVTNPRDPRFLALCRLQSEKGRQQTGSYLIEGIRHLARAVEHNPPIQSIFLDPSVLSNPFGQKLARRLRQSGVPGIRLAPALYRELTRAAEPQGIGAVLKQRWLPLQSAKVNRNSLWLAVESIDLPGNLGTILRTSEAAGASAVFLLDPATDPWDPGCVRASMGSLFSQQLIRCTVREFHDWARSSKVSIIASSPSGLCDFKSFRSPWPAVLLIGSERQGLSPQLLEIADFTLRIPMCGSCDSVNAAVAAGVLLFELAGQRTDQKKSKAAAATRR